MSKIWHAVGVERIWRLADGTKATENQADAIARGLLPGRSEISKTTIWGFGPSTESHARRAYRNWATTSPVYHNNQFERIDFE